jgi:hypothetical protein
VGSRGHLDLVLHPNPEDDDYNGPGSSAGSREWSSVRFAVRSLRRHGIKESRPQAIALSIPIYVSRSRRALSPHESLNPTDSSARS